MSFYVIRNLVLRLTVVMGTLSSLFLTMMPSDDSDFFECNTQITSNMTNLLRTLINLSSTLTINLYKACSKKIDLNCRKYPVDLCKVCNCSEMSAKQCFNGCPNIFLVAHRERFVSTQNIPRRLESLKPAVSLP